MALTPEQFFRRVIEEEPQTFEGGIAKSLLRFLEAEIVFEDSEKIFEIYDDSLLKERDAVSSLHSQFNREQYRQFKEEEE